MTESCPIQPILERLKSKNKWKFQGDYLSNFEKHLIPTNLSMKQTFKECVMVTFYWFRNNCNDFILPENIDIIVGEFYTLPRCGNCGMFDNLWLNLCDGYIGCGRKQWDGSGGNGCTLKHYSSNKTKMKKNETNDRKQYFPMVVKLGTISKYGADVFHYNKDIMVMDALFIQDENDPNTAINKDINKRNEWTSDKTLCIEELQPLLAHWGIQMGSMYKFDKTMAEIDIEENANFRW